LYQGTTLIVPQTPKMIRASGPETKGPAQHDDRKSPSLQAGEIMPQQDAGFSPGPNPGATTPPVASICRAGTHPVDDLLDRLLQL